MKKGSTAINEVRLAMPVETEEGLSSIVSEHFGKCPCFLICDLHGGKVRKWKIISNPGAEVDVRMGLVAAEFLIDQGVDVVLVHVMGDGPYWMLKSNSIEMFKIHPTPSSKEELEECVENYRGLPVIKK